LPDEYERVMTGINSILRKSWTISEQAEDNKEKIQALLLAKECYSMKLELLTNATVVDDAIRFVAKKSDGNAKKYSSDDRDEDDMKGESKEPDYDEDEDQLEERQEEETEEIATTTNQVFRGQKIFR
jgi:hypothetical protein